MDHLELYPSPPRGVPADFTRASAKYRRQVVIVAISLFVFLLLYLALVVATGYFTYWIATTPLGKLNEWNPILNGGGALIGGMLLLFLLKGLFKSRRMDREHMLLLRDEEQPELFGFIHRLCDEVGAPRPEGVYISPDVNAAVIYDTSLLNLIVTPRKYLLIGLGLVNCVNLREFKATLAHEFGHFSQRSLALGRYTYITKQIITDMVYSRDAWDRWLHWWARIDIRITFPAWIVIGITWCMRKLLAAVFRGITLADLVLSRQMEFNADDVAVSAAGSDAIVTVLCRLEFATEALNQASADLFTAADHELYSRDLFYHQTAEAEWMRANRKEPQLGLPPERPAEVAPEEFRVFDPAKGDDRIPPMWRTHPANHERERNAKRIYIPAESDERSPWLLFQNVDAVKEAITRLHYEINLGRRIKGDLRDPAEVQAFIDAEHVEMTYDPRYHGLYEDRYLKPGKISELIGTANAEPWSSERLAAFLQSWPSDDLKERMEKNYQRRMDYELLGKLQSGEYTLKGKTFQMRGQEYTLREVPELIKELDKEFEADDSFFHSLDAEVFLAHYQIALELDKHQTESFTRRAELEERYEFHLRIQDLLRKLIDDDRRVQNLLNYLQGKSNLHPDEFKQIVDMLNEVSRNLRECVHQAKDLKAPALKNIDRGTTVDQLIWEKETDLPQFGEDISTIHFEMIVNYLHKQNAAQNRLRRLHFKSLGNILALQERLVKEWQAATALASPTVTVNTPPSESP